MKGSSGGSTPGYLETKGRRKHVFVRKDGITNSHIPIHRI